MNSSEIAKSILDQKDSSGKSLAAGGKTEVEWTSFLTREMNLTSSVVDDIIKELKKEKNFFKSDNT